MKMNKFKEFWEYEITIGSVITGSLLGLIICAIVFLLILMFAASVHAETVLTSSETFLMSITTVPANWTILESSDSLKETDQEVWKKSYKAKEGDIYWSYPDDPQFYYLIATTEMARVKDYWTTYYKFRKVYYPIVKTECFEWEQIIQKRVEKNSFEHCINCPEYEIVPGACIAERVYMKDYRVLWRKVQP